MEQININKDTIINFLEVILIIVFHLNIILKNFLKIKLYSERPDLIRVKQEGGEPVRLGAINDIRWYTLTSID